MRQKGAEVQLPGIAGLIAEIRAEIGACRLCPAMKPHRKLPPESFGTTTTGYVLVGEAASMGARPFDDPAGQVLRESLQTIGDENFEELEDLFFLTQAVRCVPRKRDKETQKLTKKLRPPTRTECRTCLPYLQFELRALHPKLVIAIGTRAAEAVLCEPIKILEAHGRRWRMRDSEVLTLVSPSPHNRASLKKLDMTLESYRRWLTGLFGSLIDRV